VFVVLPCSIKKTLCQPQSLGHVISSGKFKKFLAELKHT
jgi:hypothetical protein